MSVLAASLAGPHGHADEARARADRLSGRPLKLRTAGLTKRYGDVLSLAATDLAMAEGEFLTLLGPSGSGKTTLLSLIAGLVEPDAGEIWIDGQNATRVPSKKRDLGLVFQNYALFPHLSVYENIAFALRMRRMSERDIGRAVGQVLEVVRLSHLAERMPQALSGGQQQRVALARCFVYQPSIILMDEPLGALDKRLRDHMQIEIVRLSREVGASVIYVTHDQEEALVMSDRICLLNEGRVEQIGTPEELYFSPANLFTAGFLGESNRFRVTVSADGEARLPDGSRVLCRTPVPVEAGPASVIVRPENLELLPGAGALEPDNRIDAVIERVVLTGPLTRVMMRSSDGAPLVATLPSRIGGARVRPGDAVRVGFDRDSAILLNGTSEAGRTPGAA
ncbi:ABC transporter ATP-binding protein [Caballeronia ptereochthonis]|uniref:Spermidine/putrescine ABC transporter ATPase n=1 Tax=Caballeronia ptereochthonis TaxID=1777144 RepID=A0A158B3U7_9BURK|nr:ABC transporter ATP-binding protein [Caballeronia ptereochthonis]SAK64673.1 spermidine/putrescine ABC transporter ATPase [Caballeronia ptereochthonis]